MEINAYLNMSAAATHEFDPKDYLYCDAEEDVLNALYDDFRMPSIPYMQDCTIYIDSLDEIVDDVELSHFLEKWRELKDKENE